MGIAFGADSIASRSARQAVDRSSLSRANTLFETRRAPLPKPKEDAIVLEGTIVESLPNAMFRVELENGHKLLARLAGRMRRNRIRVSLGDSVKVEISPYDMERGRVTYRL